MGQYFVEEPNFGWENPSSPYVAHFPAPIFPSILCLSMGLPPSSPSIPQTKTLYLYKEIAKIAKNESGGQQQGDIWLWEFASGRIVPLHRSSPWATGFEFDLALCVLLMALHRLILL
jgi:hypothetical protein